MVECREVHTEIYHPNTCMLYLHILFKIHTISERNTVAAVLTCTMSNLVLAKFFNLYTLQPCELFKA